MKNTFILAAILLLVSVVGFGQTKAVKASSSLPAGVQPATQEQFDALKAKIVASKGSTLSDDNAKSNPSVRSPLFVIESVGNSFTGITSTACNVKPIPADTMIWGSVTGPDGSQSYKNIFYIIQEVEPGVFCYPLVTNKQYDWTDAYGVATFEMFAYKTATGELVSQSFSQKSVNRYWANEQPVPKLITNATTLTMGSITFIKLEGRINLAKKVSIMVRNNDSNAFYPTPVPQGAIQKIGGSIAINLSLMGFNAVQDAELLVSVSNESGQSDQSVVVVK